jgi:hypothetical protein
MFEGFDLVFPDFNIFEPSSDINLTEIFSDDFNNQLHEEHRSSDNIKYKLNKKSPQKLANLRPKSAKEKALFKGNTEFMTREIIRLKAKNSNFERSKSKQYFHTDSPDKYETYTYPKANSPPRGEDHINEDSFDELSFIPKKREKNRIDRKKEDKIYNPGYIYIYIYYL